MDWRPQTLVEVLSHRAAELGDRMLFRFLNSRGLVAGELTYAGLQRDAARIGGQLQQFAAPGARALLLYPPGLDFIRAFFACLYAGITPAPAYPPVVTRKENAFRRMKSILTNAEPVAILGTQSICDMLAQQEAEWRVEQPVRLVATDTLAADASADWQPSAVTTDSLALLQYTSGSTGDPRGVMVTHGNLIHNLGLIRDAFGADDQAIGVFWLPFHHDMGLIGGMLSTAFCGGTSTLFAPIDFVQRPFRWLEQISTTKATVSGGPNFAYDECVRRITPEQRATLDLSSWKLAFCGAEPVKRDTMAAFVETFAPCGFRAESLYPCYGLAESTLMVTGPNRNMPVRLDTVDKAAEALEQCADKGPHAARVPCGVARGDLRVLVVNPESGTPAADNVVGEVWVSGGSVAQGYWNRPQETEEVFGAKLADGSGPFLRTGDLGFFHDGQLHIAGRLKDLIIICGRNVYPEDIETTVTQCHTALRPNACAAFAVEEEQGECLVVVAEVDHRALAKAAGGPDAIEPAAIVNAIRRAVFDAHELSPKRVVLVRALSVPRTTSGKIRRRACRDLFLADELELIA
jgi:acyl-CoA synthetase (AMP-forming)/AMP-acid ligase II